MDTAQGFLFGRKKGRDDGESRDENLRAVWWVVVSTVGKPVGVLRTVPEEDRWVTEAKNVEAALASAMRLDTCCWRGLVGHDL